MNAVNLNLILSIDNHANNNEYLANGLTLRQISFFEKIWREFLSFFCDCFDSTRVTCLRASLFTIMHDEQIHPRLTIYSRIRRIFQEYAPNIQTMPAPELEELVETLEAFTSSPFKGSRFLKSKVPMAIWKTLENLFENSLYRLEKIPLYSLEAVEEIERDKMTFPLAAGWLGSDKHPFIAIKVERVLDQQDDVSRAAPLKWLVLLRQYHSDEGLFLGGCGRYAWSETSHHSSESPFFFGSGCFTYLNTGEGPTEDHKENFACFKEFLEKGEGVDLRGVKWRIAGGVN